VELAHPLRECTAHDQPHDHLGALEPAALGVLGNRELREFLRVLLEQVEELHVPRRVVEAGAFAVDLV
jgi:hypothetical protein